MQNLTCCKHWKFCRCSQVVETLGELTKKLKKEQIKLLINKKGASPFVNKKRSVLCSAVFDACIAIPPALCAACHNLSAVPAPELSTEWEGWYSCRLCLCSVITAQTERWDAIYWQLTSCMTGHTWQESAYGNIFPLFIGADLCYFLF